MYSQPYSDFRQDQDSIRELLTSADLHIDLICILHYWAIRDKHFKGYFVFIALVRANLWQYEFPLPLNGSFCHLFVSPILHFPPFIQNSIFLTMGGFKVCEYILLNIFRCKFCHLALSKPLVRCRTNHFQVLGMTKYRWPFDLWWPTCLSNLHITHIKLKSY